MSYEHDYYNNEGQKEMFDPEPKGDPTWKFILAAAIIAVGVWILGHLP